jgi:hypothetical protein
VKSIVKWAKRIVIGILVVIAVAAVVYFWSATRGGIPGQYAVVSGLDRGYIDVDDGMAGTLIGAPHTIYTESVLDMGFCTKDQALVDKATKYANRHLHVIIEYRSINDMDLQSLGCEKRTQATIVYFIKDIHLSLAGEMENRQLEKILELPHDSFYEAPKP